MPQGGQGYGVAGSRNHYSYRVRLDNWTEDFAGVKLVNDGLEPKIDYRSTTKLSYIPPAEMEDVAGEIRDAKPVSELIEKNRTGLSYEMMFLHGERDSHAPEKTYFTTYNLANAPKYRIHEAMQNKDTVIDVKRSLTKDTMKNRAKENNLSKGWTTVAKSAAWALKENTIPIKKVGAPLPSFRVHTQFSEKNVTKLNGR